MPDSAPPGPSSAWPAVHASEPITLSDAVTFIRRRFWSIAGSVGVLVALAILYVLTTPAQYVAQAQLLIEPAKQQALWAHTDHIDTNLDNAQVESQVQVLLSERIGNAVIAKLHLADDPEFRSSGSPYQQRRATLDKFEGDLSARRVGQSYVIQIAFRSRDPEKAARITNAVTDAYLRDQQDARQATAEEASQWLENQIVKLGSELNTAAAAVQKYRVSHGISDTGANGQPQLIDKLTELEARAGAYRKVYEGLVERFTANQEQSSFPVSDARVITPASQPLAKAYPKAKLILLLAILGGLLIGIAIAAVQSLLDDAVQSARQVRQRLGLPVLGTLPACPAPHADEPSPADGVAVVDAPASPLSEAVRNVGLSVQNRYPGGAVGTLGVVSLYPGEGASTVALNLAALFAAGGTDTLLVDADIRARGLSRRLVPAARHGLADVLHETADPPFVYDPHAGIHILPLAGNAAEFAAPPSGPAMRDLLSALRRRFGTIIVDLPALSHAVDARAIAPLLDRCLIVAAHGRTPVSAIEEAVEVLRSDGAPLLGLVINRVSDGIPPLFGIDLDRVGNSLYARLLARTARAASR